MQLPNIITKLSEHFKADADMLKEKYGFEFQVKAYRKVTAGEIVFAKLKTQQKVTKNTAV